MASLADLLVSIGLDSNDLDTGLTALPGRFDKVAGKMRGIGLGLTGAITAPLIAVGGFALRAAADYDGALDTISLATGATGQDLEDLGAVAKTVFSNIPTDIQSAADTVATLSIRTDLQGEALARLAETEIELARITGTDLATNVDTTTQMFDKWYVATGDEVRALDLVFAASQLTGVSITDLTQGMTTHAATLQALGMPYETALALLANLEQAGINTDQAMVGLKSALAKMAEEGITDANVALQTLVDKIKAAPDDMAATQLAIDYFGARAGPELAKAIRDGTFSVTDLATQISNSEGTIIGAASSTNDFAEKFTVLKNNATLALLPIGTLLFNAINASMPMVERFAGFVQGLSDKFAALSPHTQSLIGGALLIAAAIGPVLMGIGFLIPAISGLGAVLAVLTGPIGLVIAAIALLFIAYQTNFLGFADGVNAGVAKVQEAFTVALPYIQQAADLLKTAFTASLPFLTAAFENVKALVSGLVDGMVLIFTGFITVIKGILQIIKGIFTGDFGLIKEGVTNIIKGLVQMVQGQLTNMWAVTSYVLSQLSLVFTTIWDAIKGTVTGALTSLIDSVTTFASDIYWAVWSAGAGIGQGFIDGINSKWNDVINFAGALADAVYNRIKDSLQFWSPSRKTRYAGQMVAEGLIVGMESAESEVANASTSLGTAALSGISSNYGDFTFNVYESSNGQQTADMAWQKFSRELGLAT